MTAIGFDPQAYSARLQKGGLLREQADAIAEAQAVALNEMIKVRQLATKQDILEAKHDIIKWVMGMIVAQTALIITVFAVVFSLLNK